MAKGRAGGEGCLSAETVNNHKVETSLSLCESNSPSRHPHCRSLRGVVPHPGGVVNEVNGRSLLTDPLQVHRRVRPRFNRHRDRRTGGGALQLQRAQKRPARVDICIYEYVLGCTGIIWTSNSIRLEEYRLGFQQIWLDFNRSGWSGRLCKTTVPPGRRSERRTQSSAVPG